MGGILPLPPGVGWSTSVILVSDSKDLFFVKMELGCYIFKTSSEAERTGGNT